MIYYSHGTSGKGHATALLLFLLIPAIVLVACSSAKTIQKNTTGVPAFAAENLCNSTIRFYIEKSIVTMDTGEENELNKSIEITVNPSEGRFTMATAQAEQKGLLEMKTISCNLAAKMISGEAVYEIIDEEIRENGNTEIKRIKMLVQATNEGVFITLSDQVPPGGMKSAVARWELLD